MTDKLPPEQVDKLLNGLASGKSLRAICRDMELPESTVRGWIKDDPELFAQSARAKDLGYDALADECIDIADSTSIDPADKRIRIDTRLRLLGKWSQRYSDKTTTALTGPDGGAVQSVTKVEWHIVDTPHQSRP